MTSIEAAERLFLVRRYARISANQTFRNDKAQVAILDKFSMDVQGEIMAAVAAMELRDTQGLMPLYGKDEGAQ